MSLNPIQSHVHAALQPIISETQKLAQPESSQKEVNDGMDGVKTTREERLKRNKEILNKCIIEQMRVAMQNHARKMQEIAREEQAALEHA